jgi:diguanylate cyclase (GGDEF)-like protein/PAS domain S-box-containing protein
MARGWRRQLLLLVVPLVAIVVALLVLVAAGLGVLTAARGFVTAEAFWSKAQKDAVHHLQTYARTHDERDYRRYLEAIAVPLAGRKARLALQETPPDLDAARQGFIEGRNHPEDAEAMARLLVRLRNFDRMAQVVRLWRLADEQIDRLRVAAQALRDEVNRAPRDSDRIAAVLREIDTVNGRIAPLEQQFSTALGETTRWVKRLLFAMLSGIAVLLVGATALIMHRGLRRTAAAEAAMRESEERLRHIANNVPALISYLDREQRFRFSNKTYEDWFGVAPARMPGRSVAEVFGDSVYEAMRRPIERVLHGEEVQFELATRENGRERTLQMACVPHVGRNGKVAGFYMLGNDVTALKRAQEDLRFAALQLEHDARRLEFLAHHDALTGLPNRAMFDDRARQALAHARRHGKSAAVLFIDLDGFKAINDTHGHDVGDQLLGAIAGRLRGCVRGEDFISRIGGDEFCVLLQEIGDPREAAAVAQKLLHELGKPYRIGEHQLSAGASIGIACVPQDASDVPTLLKQADAAMYRAKESGRNSYQYFSMILNRDAATAAAFAEELRAGMERGELLLLYQPRLDLATRQVVGAEALLRWRHPKFGLLSAESFLPVADEHGLLVSLGAWALRQACTQGRRWLDAGMGPLCVVVNMNVRQLRHMRLAQEVQTALRMSGLPGERLLIEIPEGMVREVPEALQETLMSVATTGARLGVDDFGTGYSSLPMLQRLGVDTVCIDRKLVMGLPEDKERAGLARALVALARGLDFEVMAKGIDTQAQRDFLAEIGCRVGQGDLIAPPGPAKEIEPLLARRRAA